MIGLVRWIAVCCKRCNKVHCEAAPGSVIKFRCKGCRRYQVVEVP